jgi:hypothetical protein
LRELLGVGIPWERVREGRGKGEGGGGRGRGKGEGGMGNGEGWKKKGGAGRREGEGVIHTISNTFSPAQIQQKHLESQFRGDFQFFHHRRLTVSSY